MSGTDRIVKRLRAKATEIAKAVARTEGEGEYTEIELMREAADVIERGCVEWRDISTVPKHTGKGDVPAKYIVLLHDPDNSAMNRVQVGFWNNRCNYWQTLFDNEELMCPTHWAPWIRAPKDML
ncbi:MAG TPA: hypothetical protein VGG45_16440 [Terracidiphilus sp.]